MREESTYTPEKVAETVQHIAARMSESDRQELVERLASFIPGASELLELSYLVEAYLSAAPEWE
jgi:hypothetical protein